MNRRMIVSVAVVLCSIALAGCAAGTPAAIPPASSTTDQPVPLTGSTSTGTMPAAAIRPPWHARREASLPA